MLAKTDRCMKKLNKWDVWMIKTGSAAFILFLITVWPAAMDLVHRIHWGWFLAATVLLMIRPVMKWLKA